MGVGGSEFKSSHKSLPVSNCSSSSSFASLNMCANPLDVAAHKIAFSSVREYILHFPVDISFNFSHK